ncbi:MAG: hypothetical protein IKQ58_09160 [Prevotella sp.]|nr:hypothetical protein [Prevotella sp.]
MRQLNNWQNAIFLVGALLMVVGAGASLLQWSAAPYLFALGVLGFASMQMLQRYEGSNFVIRRLRRIMLLSDVLFLVSAVLMFASQENVFGLSHITYLQYVYNKWVVTLLIAAILQLYTTHRIGNELEKEAKKL